MTLLVRLLPSGANTDGSPSRLLPCPPARRRRNRVHRLVRAAPRRSSPRRIAREGFPAVTIDQQHGLWDTAATVAGIAAIRAGGAAPVVRVPLGAFDAASRALDFGAEGVIAPMINTVADARPSSAPPSIRRSASAAGGRTRAMTLAGITDLTRYLREANDNVVTLAMIETSDRDGEPRCDRGDARHRRAVRRTVRPVDRADRRRRARSALRHRRGGARPDRRRGRTRPARSRASIAPTPSARSPAPSAASASSRSAATSASCAPARQRSSRR